MDDGVLIRVAMLLGLIALSCTANYLLHGYFNRVQFWRWNIWDIAFIIGLSAYALYLVARDTDA